MDFHETIKSLSDKPETCADFILDHIDNLLFASNWEELNHILKEINLTEASIDLMITLLCATLPAKSKIEYRSIFIKQVEEEIVRRGEMGKGLLDGL